MFNKNHLYKILGSTKKISYKNLTKLMKISFAQNKFFSKFLFDLIKQKKISMTNEGEYFLIKFIDEIEGEINITSKGFGFVKLNDEKSIFILAQNTNTAIHKDIVKIKYFQSFYNDDSLQGEVIKIVERHFETFVGKVVKRERNIEIIPFNSKIYGKFFLEPKNKENILENLEVKVKITKYQKNFHYVKIIKKIGFFDDPFVDINMIIEDFNIKQNFQEQSLKEAQKILEKISDDELKKRTDLRNELIITIDGEDSKDFDDAICIKKLENGNYFLGVYIADVSHYIKENSFLDKEAREKGTSIYLPHKVIAMLPEKLSNNICSLMPNKDRLVIACEMEINNMGETINYKIFPGIINSKYRLTYDQVNLFFENKQNFENKNLENMLLKALELSKIIRNKKINSGYIDFEIEESKIIVNKEGYTEKIQIYKRKNAEIMIENFMVKANEQIAFIFHQKKYPFIYRVHNEPQLAKMQELKNIMKILKIDVKIHNSVNSLTFAKIINKIKKIRFDNFIKLILLRTMSKACYSSKNTEHFGLASQFYTHFTSPIRRYPDLIVHRMIRHFIFKNYSDKNLINELENISLKSSLAEQKAVDLERKINDFKKAQFYEKFINEEFEVIIVMILNFGLFVEFLDKTSGLIHVSTFKNKEAYKVLDQGCSFSKGNKKYSIGEKIKVKIISIDKKAAKINLEMKD